MGYVLLVGMAAAVCVWSVTALDEQDRRAIARGARHVVTGIERLLPGAASATAAESASLGRMSEMVDVIRLGLSAGLSFDAALGLYCEQSAGQLATRMLQARLTWQMGMEGREESLLAAARDLKIRQLESFATAVGQAHAMGAPLADTLAQQGAEMRAAHRAAVEREIERAPVKLLIPTGTLILPALLLSIIGPLLGGSGML